MNILIENVRVFSDTHNITLKPLTIITGENSSGKSTFLALLSVLFSKDSFPLSPSFNEAPYNLGGYDTIATFKGGKYGRAKHFRIGYSLNFNNNFFPRKVEATYRNRMGQPELSYLMIEKPDGRLSIIFEDNNPTHYTGIIQHERLRKSKKKQNDINTNKAETISFSIPRPSEGQRINNLIEFILEAIHSNDNRDKILPNSFDILQYAYSISPYQALSIAPIRTKPHRTYDNISESFQPEGDHIPFLLARLNQDKATLKESNEISQALVRFGQESGMFKDLRTKRLGHKSTDPFQIMVDSSGRAANLIDVGYGVSQALPIIVQSVLTANQQLVLLQQPEVHLHPRAQAALGTFFAELTSKGVLNLVIETHSDYVVDRIRQEIAKGTVENDDVEILFFEKSGHDTHIHHIHIDRNGNIMDAPPSYRQFFLLEEINLLSRTSSI